jgi:hypothetical protein
MGENGKPMRFYVVGVVGLLGVGCAATPTLTLRVSPAAVGRLGDRPERKSGQAAIEAAQKTLALAQAEQKRAEGERAGPVVANRSAPRELDAVMRAAVERKEALVEWRAAQVEVARWQVACAQAQLEQAMAEIVARSGADVDPAEFRAQSAHMQEGRLRAGQRVTQARAQLDVREKALANAKDRYAATVAPAEAAAASPSM